MSSRRDFLSGLALTPITGVFLPRAAFAREVAATSPADTKVVRLAIYPALGISRVGNSAQWFLAPEIPGIPPLPAGDYKDGVEKIKKQVQRFRVYGFNAAGDVVREVTASEASIEWSVHVANTKAAWYGFSNPLDNGDAAPGLPGPRRNQAVVGDAERAAMLVIDPGPVSIRGEDANANGGDARYAMVGRFWKSIDVKLGELRTDSAGRLLVFPGDGSAQSAYPNNPITNFSDNDGWHDDWCDGVVRARVTFAGGASIDAQEAWIACCGPSFAPAIPPFISLYDVMTDVNEDAGWTKPLEPPLSFRKDIYPLFHRLALMDWVAAAANLDRRWLDYANFDDPAFLAKLRDPGAANAVFRRGVFAAFRDPRSAAVQADKLPQMLGDGINYADSPLRWLRIPPRQYAILEAWRDGKFVDDLGSDREPEITKLEEIPLAQQPGALTRAVLESCSGGAFHPGVELTWPLRHKELYAAPYRIALAKNRANDLIQDLGRLLTPERAFNGFGATPPAIGPQMPGDLTRWMGLPWQCDAFSCQSVTLDGNGGPPAAWWPALLPIDVLPEAHYHALMNPRLPSAQRVKFYESRVAWSRGAAGIGYHANASYTDGLNRMIYLWARMGIVVPRPGPTDGQRPPEIPATLYVEIDRGSMDLAR
jgi:L-Lysine epsilon oxidase N-terminal/L-lysine epsilon oxidase C-terminal domain